MPRGPAPKAPELRQRQNRESTRAKLPSVAKSAKREVPPLPKRIGSDWHPMVVEWWRSVWQSPMASEYLSADINGGLYLLADLYQIRWTGTPREVLTAASMIQRQEIRFGLSPIDRRRLQWEIEKDDEFAPAAVEEPKPAARKKPKAAADPRNILSIAS